jgi:hypothetical protein
LGSEARFRGKENGANALAIYSLHPDGLAFGKEFVIPFEPDLSSLVKENE